MPAMGEQIVVPTIFQDTGPQIIAIAAQITQELSYLWNQLQPFINGIDWQGSTNVSWATIQSQWNSAANELISSEGTLGSLGQTAAINWQNHVDTESANTRTWQH